MSLFQAIILGLIQGLTEFFPISSSAHLHLAKSLMHIQDKEPYFDLVCHMGTLLALCLYLRSEIWNILKDRSKWGIYFLALIPLVPAYFFLKPLRTWASQDQYLGYSLLITSALLFLATRTYAARQKWKSVLCIGVMQTMALVPGISRSGSTISAARFCGWDWKAAAQFSFLLSVPTILGGEILESVKLLKIPPSPITLPCYFAGFLSAFFLGSFAVKLVFWIYEKERIQPFAWYCFALGVITWAFYG